MPYPLNTLTTVAACDELINVCGREKTALQNRKNNLLERLANGDASTGMEQRVAFLTNRISSLEGLIAQDPPEEDLRDMQMSLGDLIRDRAVMERKIDQIGDHWQIESTFQANLCDAEIGLRDALIVEVEMRKANLLAQGGQAA